MPTLRGHEQVLIIRDKRAKMPSDLDGVIYIAMDRSRFRGVKREKLAEQTLAAISNQLSDKSVLRFIRRH